MRPLSFHLEKVFKAALFLSLFTVFAAPVFAGASAAASGPKADTDYLIGPEDELDVLVWKNADLSRKVIVRPDGIISLPLIGEVPAAGLTPLELRSRIIERLKDYQQDVEVSVIVTAINSYKVFIFGDVNNPGVYILHRKTSLVQAIAMAGGFNQFASRNNIIIIREGEGRTSKRFTVRFDDIMYKDKFTDRNLILRPGDTIFVP